MPLFNLSYKTAWSNHLLHPSALQHPFSQEIQPHPLIWKPTLHLCHTIRIIKICNFPYRNRELFLWYFIQWYRIPHHPHIQLNAPVINLLVEPELFPYHFINPGKAIPLFRYCRCLHSHVLAGIWSSEWNWYHKYRQTVPEHLTHSTSSAGSFQLIQALPDHACNQ